RYLPPALWDDAYLLDQYGTWESVYYNGTSRWFWRPRITGGWRPFTVGRWAYWHGDQTWIPDEPFGYVTHHYGNWIHARNRWYWAPPVIGVTARLPLLNIGFFWWPGRVSWIYSQDTVGWVPLAPNEPYYTRRPWGGARTVVVNDVTINRININVTNLTYRNQSVIVPRADLYTTNNYGSVRLQRRAPDIGRYRAAPVIDRAVPGHATMPQRFNFSNARLAQKPHNTVVERLRANRTAAQQVEGGRQVVSQSQARSIPEGRINRQVKIPEPSTRNYLVPAGRVNAPATEIQPRATTLKKRPEALTPEKRPSITAPSSQAPTAAPPAKPRQTTPQRPRALQPGPTGQEAPAGSGIPSPREQRSVTRQGQAPAAKPAPQKPGSSTAPAPAKTAPPQAGPEPARKLAPQQPSAKPSETPAGIAPQTKRPVPPERPAAVEKPKAPSTPAVKPSEQAERRSVPSARPRATPAPAERPSVAPAEKAPAPSAEKPAPPRTEAPPRQSSPSEKPAAERSTRPEKASPPRAAETTTPPPEKPAAVRQAAPPSKQSLPSERRPAAEKPRDAFQVLELRDVFSGSLAWIGALLRVC
ncbi:MAG TPA: DUF6600 domain-containing protein, partial [Syntrophorhabdaceae bacterium]|nr:DUF6600 domain-containing protein [Syntrophorhabdaceae bacterium]